LYAAHSARHGNMISKEQAVEEHVADGDLAGH
jgi:hypothetical protein